MPLPASKLLSLYRLAISLGIALLFILHTAGWLALPLLLRLENVAYDLRLQATLSDAVDPRIVIVSLDDDHETTAHRPWNRKKLARLVDVLFDRYSIKLLGFDLVLAEPDNFTEPLELANLSDEPLQHDEALLSIVRTIGPQRPYDSLLAASIAHRPIVLGYLINTSNGEPQRLTQLPPSVANVKDLPFSPALHKSRRATSNLPGLQQASDTAGYIDNPGVDTDGVYRKLPLLARYQNKVYDAFPLALYRKLLGLSPTDYRFNNNQANKQGNIVFDTISIGNAIIPVDHHAAMFIPYRGKPDRFQVISASQILNGNIDLNQLTSKIAIVGSGSETRPAPLQTAFPNAGIHATVLSALLDQHFISRPGFLVAVEAIELVIISLIAIFLFPRLSLLQSSIAFAIILALLVIGNFYCWQQLSIDTVLAMPLLLLTLLFAIPLSINLIRAQYRKYQISTLFGQYVPPEVLAEMNQSNEQYSLQGESREMTVLFSDIRGFTSIAESMEPKALCDLINAVLTPVTGTIHETHGTIDKYIGDSVMAFWGAPMQSQQHAHDAILSALKIIEILEKLKLLFIARGWPAIDMGIGINTGTMNVGNMGSQFRMAYTVMGDAVNLGSRLEGLTKHYGVKIIVSETTRKAAPKFFYRELDAVRVKGKDEPIYIYEPLAEKSVIAKEKEEEIYLLHHGLSYYRQQHWQSAQEIFLQLAKARPDDKLYKLYLERIRHYQRCPPDSHWDGVFTHSEK